MSIFYRICPEDAQTCSDRACLKAQQEGICPKAATFAHNQPATKAAPAPDAGGPTAPGRG